MRLRSDCVVLALACLSGAASPLSAAPAGELRVCADPNNLPFSNNNEAGFENKLASMMAEAMGRSLSYTWWAQRRGFVRNTLKADKCDVGMGVPSGYELVETTKPYYRSTIGVHLVGDDGNNPPPAQALGELGIVDNVRGYSIYGDYRETDPPARLIEAVEHGAIDVAAVWGPLGGYFAEHSKVPLTISPIQDGERFAPQQFRFAIAMGVRKGDHVLRDQLNAFIDQHRTDIAALLRSYGVPLVDEPVTTSGGHE